MRAHGRRLPGNTALGGLWRQQQQRFVLLAPLAMVAGAGWYLTAAREPSWHLIAGWAGLAAVVSIAVWLWPTPRLGPLASLARTSAAFLLMLMAAAGVGAGAALAQAMARADTTLRAPVEAAEVSGFVISRDRSGGRLRFTLSVTGYEATDHAGPVDHVGPGPRRVRIAVGEAQARFLTPGRAIACRASLAPPSPPLAPGAYDFERRAFFDRLDAVGFALGPCRPVAAPAPGPAMQAQLWLAAVRADMAAAIVAQAPSQGGALAAAMFVGDRSYMSEEATQALQDAGLTHIVSVSGLHMAVVGGFVFFLLKRGLALFGWLALRVPVSKIAAVGALGALGVYLALSGSSVPAQRAAIMAAVAFGAVLIDRPAISMRGLGLAACLIVLLSPQAVVEPGFQMSFAATLALVAAYELLARRDGPVGSPGALIGGMQAFGRAMTGAVATSAVAGAATEIFAIQHFQRLTLYGLPVNLAAAPVIAFVVAPGAVASAIAAPFGLAGPPLQMTALALDLVLALAGGFAARPEAVQAIAPLAPWAFGLAVAGLLWACIWRGAVRIGALVCLAAAAAAQGLAGAPVAVFDGAFTHTYVRQARGPALALALGRERRFERERLLALIGVWPRDVRASAPLAPCDQGACVIALRGGGTAVWIDRMDAFADPCPRADVVFTALAAPASWRARCGSLALFDATTRESRGAVVRRSAAGLRVSWSEGPSDRPWRRRMLSGVASDE